MEMKPVITDEMLIERAKEKYFAAGGEDQPCKYRSDVEGDLVILRNVNRDLGVYSVDLLIAEYVEED